MRDLMTIFIDFKSGNTEAFLELIENKYVSSIIKTTVSKTLHFEEDEIVSEIYIMITSRANNLIFNSSPQVTSYLNQAIRGLVKNLSEKRASQQHRECEYNEALQNTFTFPNEDTLEENEITNLLMDKPFLRERILEDKTYQQIASKHGVTLAKVYRDTKKSEEQIRDLLKK
ncbi:RNA polymerase sigma factor [Alkalihalobacterium chitinilyticum]|uniref:Sigma-70 family RNA polymerase sigma factor n=1 Tax=Alkalihalobacterium chitinilyticum TaxID=2980103 RepID=A0ABT5VJ60_9BACI|nr:hypothetical protein [Alkalihalobacterium chitinilyticum]MDE5415495.1 hypothetical protein [Alkalihalobacterium chitinilyticum]